MVVVHLQYHRLKIHWDRASRYTEEYVVAIIELEHVEIHVITFDQWNTVFHGVEISTE